VRRAAFVTVDRHGHILQQRPEELLFVAHRGRGRGPHASDIVTERAEALGVGWAEGPPVVALPKVEFALGLLQVSQTLLPLGFQAAGHEVILGLDRAIAAFGAVGCIPRPLDGEVPLRERRIVVGAKLGRRDERSVHGGWSECGEEGRRHRVIDLDSADREAVDAAAVDQVLARAVVTGRGLVALIMGVQSAAAVSAYRETLQQRGALSHGPSWPSPLARR
jgi:hypothetical protein